MKETEPVRQSSLGQDVEFGFLGLGPQGSGRYSPRLVLNQDGRTVEHAIIEELKACDFFTFSVAFVSPGAIAQLKQHLLDFRGQGRIITSDFLGFNQPQAFLELLNLARSRGFDVFRFKGSGFHPKGYVFENGTTITAMIGSSNLTNSALSNNYELNLRVSAAKDSDLAGQIQGVLLHQQLASENLTAEWVQNYSENYEKLSRPFARSRSVEKSVEPVVSGPNMMQNEALTALDLARARGAERCIIISATGTGKTMLSAFDVAAVNPSRLLFVVHREQILDRTILEYKRVLGGRNNSYGKLTGSHKELDSRFVFATVQTLSQKQILSEIEPDEFDYIIIDEAHRAGSTSYQRVLQHFRPKFLLGMTATPERTDGFNVFELFDHNVPYEIRLQDALESGMLCPFHYYGVSDISFADGTTTTDTTAIGDLTSPDRVTHLVRAIETYGQSGVDARGLIFCSRKDEARALSSALNTRTMNGRMLRTVALTGEDPIEVREECVRSLEQGRLDYILSVDVFNEGVDIPSINQIIMLRQTQSAIVFVQQLGRGLRLADGKDYLVVIDFIGNYSNNFLIPIALFGDDSLNKESLRERLTEKVEAGALPGLSSVSFDAISRDRILRSISQTRLDSISALKSAVVLMQNRVGGIPSLWDFYRFGSVDPVALATKQEHYTALASAALKMDIPLSDEQSRMLSLLSHEILAGKRLQEFVLLELLLSQRSVTIPDVSSAFKARGISSDQIAVDTAIDTLAVRGFPQWANQKYGEGIVESGGVSLQLTGAFLESYDKSQPFRDAVDDLIRTGSQLTSDRYQVDRPFTPGLQYTRYDAAHILGWDRKVNSTIYGYKTDVKLGICAIFVTLEKSDDVSATTAYQDRLLDPSAMQWFSRSNRTLNSGEVAPIVAGEVLLHVFVKKDDAEGGSHYYLGQAMADQARNTTMPDLEGRSVPVVTMLLRFNEPIRQGLFDYFSPQGIR